MASKNGHLFWSWRSFVAYWWPRFVLFSLLFWMASWVPSSWSSIDLSELVSKLISVTSLSIFTILSCSFGVLEIIFRALLGNRTTWVYWFYTRLNKLSVTSIEIFTGMVCITTIISLNLLIQGIIQGLDWMSFVGLDALWQFIFSLGLSLLLYRYRLYIAVREDALTKRWLKRRKLIKARQS